MPYVLRIRHERGDIAIGNAQQTGFWDEGYSEIGPEAIFDKYILKKKSCFGCINHCRSWFEIKEGPYAGLKGVGIEFATQLSWGAVHDNSYAPSIYKCFILCNQYGLDQSQCGQLIAAATEWYEKGIITKEDTQGVKLAWGNYEAMIEMCHKIANREGIGDLLAEGGVYAAKKLGKEAEKCISHVKGILRTTGDIRGAIGYSFGLGVATRAADHLRGAESGHPFGQYEGVVKAVRNNQTVTTLADALEMCKFSTTYKLSVSLKDMTELFSAATGIKVSEEEMMEVADRIWNLERALIVREGITRKDDIIVGRYMDEPMHGGPLNGMALDRKKWDEMLDEYYELNGWDKKTGIPTRDKLEALGLKDVANELAEVVKLPG
jgi:aldehyde:ferredoxin oxidoreductase